MLAFIHPGRLPVRWEAVAAAVALHAMMAALGLAVVRGASSPRPPLPDSISVAVIGEAVSPAPAPLAGPPLPPAPQPPEQVETAKVKPPSVHPPTPQRIRPGPPPERPLPLPATQAGNQPVAGTTAAAEGSAAATIDGLPGSRTVDIEEIVPVVPPRPASGVDGNRKPDYPSAALGRRLQGRVMLRVEVSTSGKPLAVEVLSGSSYAILDQAAVTAVWTWQFIPATQAAVPIVAWVNVPIDFKIAD